MANFNVVLKKKKKGLVSRERTWLVIPEIPGGEFLLDEIPHEWASNCPQGLGKGMSVRTWGGAGGGIHLPLSS